MCDHKFIKTMQGWYCSECKQFFDKKPIPPKTEPKKKNSRSTTKKS